MAKKFYSQFTGQEIDDYLAQVPKKAGFFYYDPENIRYLVFADEAAKDEYLQDPTKTDLVIGNFEAPYNYSAEINLTSPAYNAVFLGSTGNYIDFTFDVKNKQGASTGENVNVTYTFIRNSVKKVVREVRKFGDSVHFNIDSYLAEGTNTIIVGIAGQTSLAATTVAITYQVVNLSLTDEMDISQIYDLSRGSQVVSIPYTISGYGTKVMEWYLDGVQLGFVKEEDEIVDVSANRTKYITLSNLQQGRHSLQFRAYTVINGENFYTDTLYRDVMVYTGADSSLIIGTAVTIPRAYGVLGASDSLAIYDMVQYIPYTLRFATYSPSNAASTAVSVILDDEVKGTIGSANAIENEFSLISSTSGSKTLILQAGEISYQIGVVVADTTMDLQEITDSLTLDFNALGKSNNSADKDSWSFGDYVGTFAGFNWNATSGWVNDRLEINAGASFAINYAPLAGSPTSTGKTIEVEWASKNVINDDAVICDLRGSDGAGILITATKVSLISKGGVVLETEYKAGENVRVGFVINRVSGTTNQKMSFIYANGIVSRCEAWGASDNYASNTQILFQGTAEAELSLKAIRIYDAALSNDQMLNNHILYRDSVTEMMAIYDRNDVYEEGTATFSPDKMMGRLPVMIVTGNIPTLENTSDKDTQIIVDIEYTNLQDPTKSFRMEGAAMRPQGTSSMGYPKKNFRIYTQKVDSTKVYDHEGRLIEDKLYAFKEGAQPVNCWCLKADYAESSGTHNTGIARLWNKALVDARVTYSFGDGDERNINNSPVLRTHAQQMAADSGYPYDVRTAIDGFPILLFYRLSANDDLIFIGKYNFNNDKSTESVFGFTFPEGAGMDEWLAKYGDTMQCWEILNNGNALALFTTVEGFDSGWSEAFEGRYPDKNSNVTDLKTFCTWMSSVAEENFSAEKWDHLDVYKMAAYWVYLMRHAGADQFVKNAMFTSEDGVKWYFILYDNDTINGLINTGRLGIQPTDDRQTVDASGAYVFAGHDSRLWNMLEADEEFIAIAAAVDNALYSAGISYENAIKMFDEEQADKWVERVYNQDAQYKYIGTFAEKGIDNLFMLQGKRDLHRRWWLAKRYSIFDARYISGNYKSQAVELKCINGTAAGQQFTVTAGFPLDYGYGINNVPREYGVTLDTGESHIFTTEEVVNLGDPIRIYGAPNIAELDLSGMAGVLTQVNIAGAHDAALGTMLKKLVIGKANVTNNAEFAFSGLPQALKLEYLDVQGIKGITSLDLSNHLYFKTLVATGSNIASVAFAKGAPVERLEFSTAMTSLILEQLPYLTYDNIISEDDFVSLTQINIKGCPKVSNSFDWVYNWYLSKVGDNQTCSLVMDNINWTNVNPEQLVNIVNIGHLDLKGKVVLASITLEQLNTLIDVFGESAFDEDADFYIKAPDAVFVRGRTEILEGESEQYSCIVFGGVVEKLSWSIYSGGSSYTSIDAETGLLTTTEGMGSKSLTLRVTAITTEDAMTKDMVVNVKARKYPSQSQTSIAGANRLENTKETYTLAYSVEGITGDMIGEWTLEGMDDYVVIDSYTDSSCVLKTLKQATTLKGTLSCKLTKRYNGASLFTVSRDVFLVDDSIAETDAGICQALYDAELTASPTVVTKEEARRITGADLQKGTSFSTAAFYNQRDNIKSFDGFKYFTSLVEVPTYCFYGCRFLTSITLPDSVTSLGGSCFSSCTSLTSIELPDGVTSLGYRCFSSCTSLTSINIPEGVTKLGDQCFSSCSALTSITLPEGVTSLGGSCFSGCSSLTSINIPEGVTILGTSCFASCTSLTSITIPDSVASLDGSRFYGCGSLNIIVDESNPNYSSIDGVLFNKAGTELISYAKDKIQPVYIIPDSVTSLGTYCFNNCTALTSITIPDSVTSFGTYCFADCTALTSISIPDSVTILRDRVFSGCKSLTSITIPEGVTRLGPYCLYGCKSLTSITIPDSVTSLGDQCFSNCTSLTSINIPESVTGLGDYCFYYCTSLTSITIPEGVTILGTSCFASCTSLTSITIPDSVTKLGDQCFSSCTSLTSITIPEGVTILGTFCFNNCTSLTSITCYAATAPTVQSNTFGASTNYYTGRNTYSTGENMLYVPQGATGYTTSYWDDPLQDEEKCGFTLSATL